MLLDELLGEVVDLDLVEGGTDKLVVVNRREDGVETAAAGDDGDIRLGTAKVGDDDDLVLELGLGARIISENGGDGLRDELQNLEVGLGSGGKKGGLLLVVEVGGDGDDGGGDLLAEVLGGGGQETAEVASGNLVDRESRGLDVLAGLVLDGEGYSAVNILGVGGGVVVGGVDRLEAVSTG